MRREATRKEDGKNLQMQLLNKYLNKENNLFSYFGENLQKVK